MSAGSPVVGAVTGLGICTPLGLTARATQVAFRAGISRIRETETIGRAGEPIRASFLSRLPFEWTHQERMVALATRAIDDLLGDGRPPAGPRTLVFIGLSRPGNAHDARMLEDVFTQLIQKRLPGSASPRYFWNGRCAFFLALQSALAALASRECDRALVGVSDSFCSPGRLKALDAVPRLLGPMLDGLIPGEGAAFFWLEGRLSVAAPAEDSMAEVLCAATAEEPRPFLQEEPCTAQALSSVLGALQNHPNGEGRRADLLLTCETGERFWAQELIAAYLRNPSIMPEPFSKTMAAEAFGDMGAASGGVMFGAGIHMLGRLRRGPVCHLLLCGSSDDGHVGACLVRSKARWKEPS